MKRLIIILFTAIVSCQMYAFDLWEFYKDHTQRLSAAVQIGGLGMKNTDACSMSLFACAYGVAANVSVGMFDNFDLAYPFCRQHERTEPIVSEFLFGYSFPVWSNFDARFERGFTLMVAPMYGFFQKEYSWVMKDSYSYYIDHTEREKSFGAVVTFEFFNGNIINLKGSRYGGEIGWGYSFFSPYRRRK